MYIRPHPTPTFSTTKFSTHSPFKSCFTYTRSYVCVRVYRLLNGCSKTKNVCWNRRIRRISADCLMLKFLCWSATNMYLQLVENFQNEIEVYWYRNFFKLLEKVNYLRSKEIFWSRFQWMNQWNSNSHMPLRPTAAGVSSLCFLAPAELAPTFHRRLLGLEVFRFFAKQKILLAVAISSTIYLLCCCFFLFVVLVFVVLRNKEKSYSDANYKLYE